MLESKVQKRQSGHGFSKRWRIGVIVGVAIGVLVVGGVIWGLTADQNEGRISAVGNIENYEGLNNLKMGRLLGMVSLSTPKNPTPSKHANTPQQSSSPPVSSSPPTPIQKSSHNPQNQDKPFLSSPMFTQQVSSAYLKQSNPSLYAQLQQVQIIRSIQVGSFYDYTNLTHTVDFNRLKDQMFSQIAYDEYWFQKDDKLEKKRELIGQDIFKDCRNQDDVKDVYYQYLANKEDSKTEISLGAALVRDPENKQIQQLQYHYYNNKYNLSQIHNQLPFCIYGSGYKLFSKDRYKEFFLTLQRVNYTNFHIVYVDDNSPHSQISGILQWLSKTNLSIKNRLKVIHTRQHLGAEANMYFWINNECRDEEIVLNVDADDGVIGRMGFQVVNAVYQDPNVWFAYSRYILTKDNHQVLQNGFSDKMSVPASSYRNEYSYWDVSHLRTFRHKLFSKIPLQMMIEYHIDPLNPQQAKPSFYSYAFDTFQIFSMLQMTGQQHYRHITDYLYLYFGVAGSGNVAGCYSKHQKYDDFKCRIKTPLKKMENLDEPARQLMDYRPPERTWGTFKFIYGRYKRCLEGKND